MLYLNSLCITHFNHYLNCDWNRNEMTCRGWFFSVFIPDFIILTYGRIWNKWRKNRPPGHDLWFKSSSVVYWLLVSITASVFWIIFHLASFFRLSSFTVGWCALEYFHSWSACPFWMWLSTCRILCIHEEVNVMPASVSWEVSGQQSRGGELFLAHSCFGLSVPPQSLSFYRRPWKWLGQNTLRLLFLVFKIHD